jgi:hypothetical protein
MGSKVSKAVREVKRALRHDPPGFFSLIKQYLAMPLSAKLHFVPRANALAAARAA